MLNEKKAGVMVTYNPDESTYLFIKKLVSYLDYLVIVDNNSNNGFKCTDNEKLHVIYNEDNYGLAKALNIGCEYLINEKYDYAFLFDQDSDIDQQSIEKLFQTIISTKAGIVAPRIKLRIDDNIFEGKYYLKKGPFLVKKRVLDNENKESFVCITSGSIIDLTVYSKIGGFWNELFIEMIDNEYALRNLFFKYKVIICGSAVLYQKLGQSNNVHKKFGLSFVPTNHSAKRYWYMFRNLNLVRKRYHFLSFPFYFLCIRLAFVKKYYTIKWFEDDTFNKIKLIKSSKKDAKNMKIKRLSFNRKKSIKILNND